MFVINFFFCITTWGLALFVSVQAVNRHQGDHRRFRHDYGEQRYQALGLIGARLHMLVFTRRGRTTNPEWSVEDFASARPASDVLVEIFGAAQAKQMLNPKRGRPVTSKPKEQVSLRLDPAIIEAFRASGSGWQTRINKALANWLEEHDPQELKTI